MKHYEGCEVCGERVEQRHWVTFHGLDGRKVTFKLLVCCRCIREGEFESACRHKLHPKLIALMAAG